MYPSAFPEIPNRDNFSKRQKEQHRIDTEIRAALRQFEGYPERQAAFERLLRWVRSHTELLKPAPGQGSVGWAGAVFLINRLKNLAARQRQWLRPPETWRPTDGNLRLVFRSLAHHLLALYPVPGFMDSAWDLPAGPEGFRQQAWCIRLGRGASVLELNLPLALTRKMAHYVRLAPDHHTVPQALRYGEIRGLGANEDLAREIVIGRLGRKIEHPEFWRTVLWFFVKHPELPLDQVNPVIDFIQETKFGGEEILTEHGVARRAPPWPAFSMEGRTPKSMLRLVDAWHLELGRTKKSGSFAWPPSGLQGFHFLEKLEETDHEWIIRELLDSGALFDEGKAMRHCVYTYAPCCRRGETTIWSLRLRVEDREKRMATIEVDPRKRLIIQARAKSNRRPGVRSLEVLRQWAAWARLQIGVRI